MNLENKELVEVPNATVEFVKGSLNGINTYKFNTSDGGHPMVNAMAGLAMLSEGEKLIMVNHCAPMGLFPKIESEFEFTYSDREDGLTVIEFTKKIGVSGNTDFDSTSCSGGCSH